MTDAEAEERITAERELTKQRIDSMTADLAELAAASAGSNLDDEHDPEGHTIAFEREQLAASKSRAQANLAELDAALDRLRDDRYGQCERCGQHIAGARLAMLAAARFCVSCAGQRER